MKSATTEREEEEEEEKLRHGYEVEPWMYECWYGAIGRTRSSTQYLILACGLLDFHGFRGVTDFHPLLLFRDEKRDGEKSRLFPRQPVKRHGSYTFSTSFSLLSSLSFVHREISIRIEVAISIDLYRWQE